MENYNLQALHQTAQQIPPAPASTPAAIAPAVAAQATAVALPKLGFPPTLSQPPIQQPNPLNLNLALQVPRQDDPVLNRESIQRNIQQAALASEQASTLPDLYPPPISYGTKTAELIDAAYNCDQTKFMELLRSLSQQEAALAIRGVLIHCVAKPAARNEVYTFIMNILKSRYPEINTYIKTVLTAGNVPVDVLSSAGIKQVIQHLQSRDKIKFPCFLCENYQELKEKLKEFKASKEDRIMLIVRNQEANQTPPVVHAVPIYIEKKNGNYKCILTDTLGGAGPHAVTMAQKLTQELKTQELPHQVVCYLGGARQKAPTNCPIFCIRDAIYFSECLKQGKDFFQECHEASQSCKEKHTETIRYFDRLPFRLMKMTQSLTRIQNTDIKIIEELQRKRNILGLQNVYIEKKFLKYERMLISYVISSKMT